MAEMATERVFGVQHFRLMPIIWTGTRTIGSSQLEIRESLGGVTSLRLG
jgi:hypothetical protein